jgi:hypothetical protein
MPECLREFLDTLDAAETDLVMEYLDSQPDALTKMLDVLNANAT